MQMKDVSDEEMRKIESGAKKPEDKMDGLSDSELIEMVQKIKKGEQPKNTEIIDTPSQLEDIEMPKAEVQETVSKVQLNERRLDSNYWKIEGLPSQNKFYSVETEIQGRPMKVLEIKKISSMGLTNGDFILNDILKKTVIGIDINDLYIADKLFIIFWLRANTYRESGYVVPFVCPKCDNESKYHFEIDSLEIQHIGKEFSPDKPIKVGGNTITYDYLRISDELYLNRFKEINSKALGEVDEELLSMAQMVKTIDGKEQSLLQKYYWIIDMSPGEYSYLRAYMEKNGMGIKPMVNVVCKNCGGSAQVAVSFRSEFFIPEYQFE